MAQVIEFEGTTHEFPDDFGPADIQAALAKVPPAGPPSPPISGPQNLSYEGTTPATATAPARVNIGTPPDPRIQRPPSLLPSSVGGAVRDFTVGAQGVGKGLVDIATGPFDLMAGAQNAVAGGLNTVLGPELGKIPMATPASKLVEQGVDATGIGDMLIDPATMSRSESIAYDGSRFGTQAIGTGAMLAQRAPQMLTQTTPSATVGGRTLDTMARPYMETPGRAHVGDAIGGIGAGVGVNAANNYLPDDPASTSGQVLKGAADALAPIVGGVGANTVQGIVQGLGGFLKNMGRRIFTSAPDPVPLNPNTNAPYASNDVDRAAQTMQAGTKSSPQLMARTIRENADELANPVEVGATPVGKSQMPTSGHLSQDPGLVTLEEGARLKDRAPFIERDQNIKEAAAERVASVRDPEADMGSVIRRAGEARNERMAPAEQRVSQFEGYDNQAAQQRREDGAPFTPLRNEEAKVNASRRLDSAVVDRGYIPARTEKNRQFDNAPGRNEQVPADDVFDAVDRIRARANDFAPGTLPQDFMRRLDELRPRMVEGEGPVAPGGAPPPSVNEGGPGTARGGDLADLRKFVGDAQNRAQQSGNFDLASNLGTLKTSLNTTIEQAPGYAEANANYRQFADRYRPEKGDEGAKFTKEIDRGGQGPDGTLNRGNTPPSETAGRFLSSPEKTAALQRILADTPGEAAGQAAIRDYMRSDFANAALNPDGTLNAVKAAAWSRNNADTLAQFPALRTEFDRIAATARSGEQLTVDTKRGLDAARNNLKQTEADTDRSAIGTLLKGKDPRDVAKRLLNGGYSTGAELDDILRVIGNDAPAKRGWKAAVAEVLTDKVTSTRAVGETHEVQYARLAKEFKDNEAILAKTFTPEEMNTLRQGHKLLSYFKEAEKRSTVGSQTAERVNIPGPAQLVIRQLYGDLKGGGIIKRFKLMLEQLPNNRQAADDIVHAAWFDPNLAAFLLEKKLPNPKASFNNVPLRRLMGAANAARESGPDEE